MSTNISMTPKDLCAAILADIERIMFATVAGKIWGTWLKAEMTFIAKELPIGHIHIDYPYSEPFDELKLDALMQDPSGNFYAIELLTDSDSEFAAYLSSHIEQRMSKLSCYSLPAMLTVHKWVVCVASTAIGRRVLEEYHAANKNIAYLHDDKGHHITVLIVNVP